MYRKILIAQNIHYTKQLFFYQTNSIVLLPNISRDFGCTQCKNILNGLIGKSIIISRPRKRDILVHSNSIICLGILESEVVLSDLSEYMNEPNQVKKLAIKQNSY